MSQSLSSPVDNGTFSDDYTIMSVKIFHKTNLNNFIYFSLKKCEISTSIKIATLHSIVSVAFPKSKSLLVVLGFGWAPEYITLSCF